jgi:hypothetical protein
VLDDWEEIVSDLSVLHRIDDPEGMPCRRFWRLVPYLTAYGGALAAKRRTAPPAPPDPPRREEPPMSPQPAPSPSGPPVRPGARVIGATAAEIGMSDLRDLVSIGDARG